MEVYENDVQRNDYPNFSIDMDQVDSPTKDDYPKGKQFSDQVDNESTTFIKKELCRSCKETIRLYQLDSRSWFDLSADEQIDIVRRTIKKYKSGGFRCKACNSQSSGHVDNGEKEIAIHCPVIKNQGRRLDKKTIESILTKQYSCISVQEQRKEKEPILLKGGKANPVPPENPRKETPLHKENQTLRNELQELKVQIAHLNAKEEQQQKNIVKKRKNDP